MPSEPWFPPLGGKEKGGGGGVERRPACRVVSGFMRGYIPCIVWCLFVSDKTDSVGGGKK